MTTYVFFALAAFFNAFMDVLLWRFPTSVFKDLNPKWWNPNVSWQYVKPFLGWMRLDAWHTDVRIHDNSLSVSTSLSTNGYAVILSSSSWDNGCSFGTPASSGDYCTYGCL